jgi:hypothetical protein
MIDHDLITVPMGMHPPLGFSSVRGTGATGSAAAILEADRTDSMVWLAPGGTWAGGQYALRIDSSGWTALGILNLEIGSTLAPTVLEVVVPNSNAASVLIEDAAGNNYLLINTASEAIELGNTATDPYVEILSDGDLRLRSQIRMTERAGDPTAVANTGFIYTKDLAGVTELYYRDSAGNVRQLTPPAGGGSLDAAYDGGRSITVDAGAVELVRGGAAETHYAIDISYSATAFTGAPHGILVDWTSATSLSNAADVYGINLIGEPNAGVGDSVGLRIDSGWDVAAQVGGDIELSGTTPTIQVTASDGTLTLIGNRVASSSSDDVLVRSTVTRTVGGLLAIHNNTTERLSVDFAGSILQTGGSYVSGARTALRIQPGAWTGQTASTEAIAVDFDLSHSVTHSTGGITTQRDALFRATTHAFVGASTITSAATVAITGNPIAGTNATIQNGYALLIEDGNFAIRALPSSNAPSTRLPFEVRGADGTFNGPIARLNTYNTNVGLQFYKSMLNVGDVAVWDIGIDATGGPVSGNDFVFVPAADLDTATSRAFWLTDNSSLPNAARFSVLDNDQQGIDDRTEHDATDYVQTTDATVTTILTVGPPSNDRTSFHMVVVQGQVSSGGAANMATYLLMIASRRSAGATTVTGYTVTPIGEENANWDVTVTSAGAIQVQGVAATTINWKVLMALGSYHISTATH